MTARSLSHSVSVSFCLSVLFYFSFFFLFLYVFLSLSVCLTVFLFAFLYLFDPVLWKGKITYYEPPNEALGKKNKKTIKNTKQTKTDTFK